MFGFEFQQSSIDGNKALYFEMLFDRVPIVELVCNFAHKKLFWFLFRFSENASWIKRCAAGKTGDEKIENFWNKKTTPRGRVIDERREL